MFHDILLFLNQLKYRLLVSDIHNIIIYRHLCVYGCLAFFSCDTPQKDPVPLATSGINHLPTDKIPVAFDTAIATIHIYVALCDNQYQGIVPVPAKIGNGQDPDNNLYWGCGYGIRAYFKNSKEWKLIRAVPLDSVRLERLVFLHRTKNWILVADAYNGQYIRKCTHDFLSSSAGLLKDTLYINNTTIGIAGNAKLIAYIGHDGLMDFQLTDTYQNTDCIQRDVILLACYSKRFFAPHLETANVRPLVWTSGLMCPEAYTVHDAITGYVLGETAEQIRSRAAAAYAIHQKCSSKAARNLLLTGW